MKERQSEEIFVGPMSPLRNLFLENVKLLGSLRSVATIRDKVLDLIFSITPADRAAIFVDHALTTRARDNREQSVSINREIIDRKLEILGTDTEFRIRQFGLSPNSYGYRQDSVIGIVPRTTSSASCPEC
jgi:hypothetical protein